MKTIILLLAAFCYSTAFCQHNSDTVYYCPECNNACDTMTFTHPGNCPVCNMPLRAGIRKSRRPNIPVKYTGHWEGSAKTPDQMIRVYLDISSNPDKVLFTSPDLKAMNITAHEIVFRNDSLEFLLNGDDEIDRLYVNVKGNQLKGFFISDNQFIAKSNQTAMMEMKKIKKPLPPYTVQDVQFNNGSVVLAGSLYLPDGKGPFPGIVCNHSSGDKPRYDGIFMADYLASRGIAVLIYDKRGNGQSSGNWRTSDFVDLAGDCIAGIKLMQKNERINKNCIGIFGHSQGATISPIIISMDSDIAFNVAASGFATSAEEQDVYRVKNILTNKARLDKKTIDTAINFYKIWLEVARTGKGWGEMESKKKEVENSSWYPWVEPPSKDNWVWSWYQKTANYNYPSYWSQVRIPTLFIWGEKDQITPLQQSITNIKNALQKADNNQYKIVIIPHASHYLASEKKAGDLWIINHGNYLKLINDWIKNQCRFRKNKKTNKTN